MALANTRGVTRWRRSSVIAVPATLAVAGMTAALLQGVLAANLSVSNVNFALKATEVSTDGTGLGLIADTVSQGGTDKASAQVGITKATVSNLCVAAPVTLPLLGGTKYINIEIPAAGTTANNLVLAASSVVADSATLGGDTANPIVLGATASSVGHGTTTTNGGNFGLNTGGAAANAATVSTLGGLNASAQQATIGGALSVNGTQALKINVADASC